MIPSEGEEGQLLSGEEDSDLHQGDPNLTQPVMTEEEQRDYDSFALASPSVQYKKGKTPLWKVSQENPQFYSQAQ